MRYKKLKDISLSNKSVLLRLDLNAPIQNGVVTNNERLLRSLPTINYLLEKGASLKIMSHLGRPEENDLFQEAFSLKPVVVELERLLDRSIPLYSLNEIESMDDFSDLVMIENTRFNIGEKNNDPTLSKRYSDLADLFVMDAFATSHLSLIHISEPTRPY